MLQKSETLTPVDLPLSNGDTITQTLQDDHGVSVCSSELTHRLSDPTYTLPERAATTEGGDHA
ncbi:hypothetical protein HHL24_07085 [Paraburkholderia sp. RP-4-7]|uniref:Uncharacterized protein n=1 Tax=Paraburkholderia polaris TaxID=2728848 RepID=A0A848I921_9BURK|nr:hypothetical protein [Paraburkholderia polaris]NML97712.1 hypothetical protein [Paraburkholderia polaris]